MKRWWYFALLVAVSSAASATAETASQVFRQVSPSVVVVLTYDAAGKATELGSGVALPNGDVATNCHVLKDGTQYRVRYRGKDFVAHLHFSDWDHDVCSLSVTGLKAPPVTLGNTKTVNVGDPVYAIGTPEGLDLTLSQGIVSSLRPVKDGSYIQTTAAISPGSSGGGLFDDQGRLLGLTSFNVTKGQQLNFALPVEWIEALPQRSTKRQVASGSSEVDFLVRAASLESHRNWPGMLAVGKEWAARFPTSSVAWEAIAEGNYGLRHNHAALINAQHALKLDPRDPEAWELLSKIYFRAARYQDAIEADQQALKIVPSNANVWKDLALDYDKIEDYPRAISAFNRALKISPENSEIWELLGEEYYVANLAQLSIDAEQRALQINPDSYIAWDSLAGAYGLANRPSDEVYADQRALQLNPRDVIAWEDLGTVYCRTVETNKEMQVYQELKVLSPERAEKFFNTCILPH